MKKKLLILAAVAVSGLAAVVASNVKNAEACIEPFIEHYPNYKLCCEEGFWDRCYITINGHHTIVYDAYTLIFF